MKKGIIALLLVALLSGSQLASTGAVWGSGDQHIGPYKVATAATEITVASEKEMVSALYTGFLNREDKIVINYSIPDYKLDIDELYKKALAIDDKATAKDNDYLAYSVKGWNAVWTSSGRKSTLELDTRYNTTPEEERILDAKIKSALQELKLDGVSGYKKVRSIHDYIINRVSYDSSLQGVTAYDAMIEQSAVCEGYSILAYRMFTEAGVECRIISGTGNGVPHAWNIVKIKGKWYNIDLTWDDPISSDGKPMLTNDYFLKNTKDFKGHKRDAEYKTDAFVKAYPISKTSYKLPKLKSAE